MNRITDVFAWLGRFGEDRNRNWHRRNMSLWICIFGALMSAYCMFRFGNDGLAAASVFGGGTIFKSWDYTYQRRKENGASNEQ